jgi:hypothetical protein
VAVEVEDCGRPNGYYDPLRKKIVVHCRLVDADQAAKTLAHEAAHYVADHRGGLDRRDAETVAEGATYVFLHHFGIDAADYTFPYVAGWAEDTLVLRRNLDTIRTVAVALLSGVAAGRGQAACAEASPAA